MKTFLKYIPTGLLSLAVTLLVAYFSLSSDPLGSDLPLFPGADKVAHFLMYFFTTLVYLYDYTRKKFPHHTKANKELLIMVIAMVLGLLMECCQLSLTVDRAFEVEDIVANCSGAAAAFITGHFLLIKWYRNLLKHSHRHHHKRRHHMQ